MLGIDKGRDPPPLLSFGDNMKRQGSLAGGLWAKNLHNPTPGDTP